MISIYSYSFKALNQLLIGLFLLVLPLKSFSQHTIDNRQHELSTDSILSNNLEQQLLVIRNWKDGSKDSLEALLHRTLDLAKLLERPRATEEVLFFLGKFTLRGGDYEKAIEYYSAAIPYAFQNQDFSHLLPRIYTNLGDAYMSLGNYPVAASYFYAALNLVPEPIDSSDLAMTIYSGIAGLHMRHENYEKALNYITRSLKIARRIQHRSLSKILGNAANIGVLYKDFETARKLQEEGLAIARKQNDKVSEKGLLLSVGELYFLNDQYATALPYFLEAANIQEGQANTHMNAYLHYIIGATYNKLHEFHKAFPYLQKSLELSKSSNIKDYGHKLYGALAENYAARGDYKTAWEYERLYSRTNDSLMSKERSQIIQDLEFRYQTIEKDMALTQKELIISRQQQAINTRNTLSGIAISSTIIVLLISFIVYKNIKSKQLEKLRAAQQQQDMLKKQEALNVMQALMEGEEKERRRIAQELHDGIGGRLAALQMYCSSEEIANRLGVTHFKEISEMLESTADEIRDTAHNLMPDVLSRYSFSDALEIYCRQIAANNALDIQIQMHASPEFLSGSTQLSLYRAIQEVLQNIIKHAHATQATIQFNRDENDFKIIIEDNGEGFDINSESGYQGMGLANLHNRIKSLSGHLIIESSRGRGTIVQMEIPINNESESI